jgi:3-ketosteroid 9alpha-monooxygenase subunit A
MYRHGWYQIAFQSELTQELTPLSFGARRLMAVKTPAGVRVFDSTCPHRGADLAYGGKLLRNAVVCPFHGYTISLGLGADGCFCIREYPSALLAGMVLIRLSDRQEPNLLPALEALAVNYTFFSGFRMTVGAPIELVTENGFDSTHFKAVHGLLKEPNLDVRMGAFGEMIVEGVFEAPDSFRTRSARAPTPVPIRYLGRAFSPGLFISELHGGPSFEYVVITAATPIRSPGQCDVRLTLGVTAMPGGSQAQAAFAKGVLGPSRDGLEMDRAIWEHLIPEAPPCWTAQDRAVMQFQEFCVDFRA